MDENGTGFHYVYALKDPRSKPALPFYIGKGAGSRIDQHLLRPDESAKTERILQIRAEGLEPIVEMMVTELSESSALRIEAELIGAFGVQARGGLLTNEVIPRGLRHGRRNTVIVPSGVLERSQVAVSLLKSAVLDLVRANPDGLTNADVTNELGLQSDYMGHSLNFLSYSVLGLLLREGSITRRELGRKQLHTASPVLRTNR